MAADGNDRARARAADQRANVADERDAIADERDAIAGEREAQADAREVIAGARDAVADAREANLLAWQQELEARARRLGLVPELSADDPSLAEAAEARDAAERERDARSLERRAASHAREEATRLRLAARRDTLLAAAFAGVAERLYEAQTAEELLTRIAEEAMTTIAGASAVTVTLGHEPGDGRRPVATAGRTDPGIEGADSGTTAVVSFPFPATVGEPDPAAATLNVFARDPAVLDQTVRDLGFILAAHAALAARAVGERIRLERVEVELEHALSSRDVIGQAKGILMERLKITPEAAFAILRDASQLPNIKLREIARRLTETGEVGRPQAEGA